MVTICDTGGVAIQRQQQKNPTHMSLPATWGLLSTGGAAALRMPSNVDIQVEVTQLSARVAEAQRLIEKSPLQRYARSADTQCGCHQDNKLI
jgi:hypothetical protein